MKRLALVSALGLGIVCATLTSCGKKEGGEKKKRQQGTGTINVPGGNPITVIPVSTTDPMAQVSVTGQLLLNATWRAFDPRSWGDWFAVTSPLSPHSSLTALAEPDTVLTFPLFQGNFWDMHLKASLLELRQEFVLGSSGSFEGVIETLGPNGVRALRCLRGDGTIDLEACKALWPGQQSIINADAKTVEQMAAEGTLDEFLLQNLDPEKICNPQTTQPLLKKQCPKDYSRVMFALRKSPTGDRVAEAASFRFIGLAGDGGGNVANLPLRAAKSATLGLGTLTASAESDEATSNVTVADTINIAPDAVAQLTAMNGMVRLLKNAHMNFDPRKQRMLRGWIKFRWNPGDVGINAFSPAYEATKLGSYGVYLTGEGDWSDTITDRKVCTYPDNETERKILSMDYQGPANDGLTLTGSSTKVRRLSSDVNLTPGPSAERRCNFGGGYGQPTDTVEQQLLTGYSWKTDEPDPRDHRWEYHWGYEVAPAYLKGSIPEGVWTVNLGSTTIGTLELGASSPVRDGFPTPFVPLVNVEKTADGTITAIRVRFAWYDFAAHAWKEVQTPEAMEKIQSARSTSASLQLSSFQGATEGWTKIVSSNPLELCVGTRAASSDEIQCVGAGHGWHVLTASNADDGSIVKLQSLKLQSWSFGNQQETFFSVPGAN